MRFRPVGAPYYDQDGDLRYDEGPYAREPVPSARPVNAVAGTTSNAAPDGRGGDDILTTGSGADTIYLNEEVGQPDAPTIADFIL